MSQVLAPPSIGDHGFAPQPERSPKEAIESALSVLPPSQKLTIGRDAPSNLTVPDNFISRVHLTIEKAENGNYIILDGNTDASGARTPSLNGVSFVSASGEILKVNDRVELPPNTKVFLGQNINGFSFTLPVPDTDLMNTRISIARPEPPPISNRYDDTYKIPEYSDLLNYAERSFNPDSCGVIHLGLPKKDPSALSNAKAVLVFGGTGAQLVALESILSAKMKDYAVGESPKIKNIYIVPEAALGFKKNGREKEPVQAFTLDKRGNLIISDSVLKGDRNEISRNLDAISSAHLKSNFDKILGSGTSLNGGEIQRSYEFSDLSGRRFKQLEAELNAAQISDPVEIIRATCAFVRSTMDQDPNCYEKIKERYKEFYKQDYQELTPLTFDWFLENGTGKGYGTSSEMHAYTAHLLQQLINRGYLDGQFKLHQTTPYSEQPLDGLVYGDKSGQIFDINFERPDPLSIRTDKTKMVTIPTVPDQRSVPVILRA